MIWSWRRHKHCVHNVHPPRHVLPIWSAIQQFFASAVFHHTQQPCWGNMFFAMHFHKQRKQTIVWRYAEVIGAVSVLHYCQNSFWHADQMSFQKHCADELCSSTLMATWPCRQHLQELSSLPSRQHCSLLCGEHFSKRYAPRVDTLQPSNLRKCRSFMPLVVCTSALWSCTTAFQQSAHATIDRCALSYCQPEHLE